MFDERRRKRQYRTQITVKILLPANVGPTLEFAEKIMESEILCVTCMVIARACSFGACCISKLGLDAWTTYKSI